MRSATYTYSAYSFFDTSSSNPRCTYPIENCIHNPLIFKHQVKMQRLWQHRMLRPEWYNRLFSHNASSLHLILSEWVRHCGLVKISPVIYGYSLYRNTIEIVNLVFVYKRRPKISEMLGISAPSSIDILIL